MSSADLDQRPGRITGMAAANILVNSLSAPWMTMPRSAAPGARSTASARADRGCASRRWCRDRAARFSTSLTDSAVGSRRFAARRGRGARLTSIGRSSARAQATYFAPLARLLPAFLAGDRGEPLHEARGHGRRAPASLADRPGSPRPRRAPARSRTRRARCAAPAGRGPAHAAWDG